MDVIEVELHFSTMNPSSAPPSAMTSSPPSPATSGEEKGKVHLKDDVASDDRLQQQHQEEEDHARLPARRPAAQATPEMCFHCFDKLIDVLILQQHDQHQRQQSQHNSVVGFFGGGGENRPHHQRHQLSLPCSTVPEFIDQLPDAGTETPIFVTWDKKSNDNKERSSSTFLESSGSNMSCSWRLRGCIGNLSPRLLVDAVGEYAIISALKDRRFDPIQLSEVQSLRCSVSLLVNFEDCQHVYDWTVGKHGIMIKFYAHETGKYYNATYLPEVASQQGWDITKTVASLIQKAGYYGPCTPELIQSIRCTRYQSSKCSVTFEQYLKTHCSGQNPIPSSDDMFAGMDSDSSTPGNSNNNDNRGSSSRISAHQSSCNIA